MNRNILFTISIICISILFVGNLIMNSSFAIGTKDAEIQLLKKENEQLMLEIKALHNTLADQQNIIDELSLLREEIMRQKDNEVSRSGERKRMITSVVTGYCPCHECSGEWGDMTASGEIAQENHTIAMSGDYPFGIKVRIEGLPYIYVVEDRGPAITGNDIDVYFNDHDEAKTFGKSTLEVEILE